MKKLIFFYILVECALQYVLNSAVHDSNMMNVAEWFSRFSFVFASVVFALNFTDKKRFILLASFSSFIFTYFAFDIAKSVLNDNQKVNAIYSIHMMKSVTPADLIKGYDFDATEMINEKVNEIVDARDKIESTYQAARYQYLIKHGVKKIRANELVYHRNSRHLKTMFLNEKVQEANNEFHKKTGLYLNKDIGMRDSKEEVATKVRNHMIEKNIDVLKFAIMIPLGFILSTIGIFCNICIILYKSIPSELQKNLFASLVTMFVLYNVTSNGILTTISNVVKMYT